MTEQKKQNATKAFYVTTTLPYVNAEPHIGFALEIIQADVLARYWRDKLGKENVFFNTGTDEHGQKILQTAQKAEKDVQEYVDYYAGKFEDLKNSLNLEYDSFVRSTNPKHIKAAQEMWIRCKKNGDIYEKEFEGLYCVGCERFLSQRDLIDDKCSIHKTKPQLLKEKNWFFNFKKYEKKLLKYLENKNVIIPEWRKEEAVNFVKEGLEDLSISRDKSRLSWGVPVPGDETQVMYVWFEALTNYISTLGWPDESGNFKKFWLEGRTLQIAGKDQVRFQSLMWQAMLMSADIKNTDHIFYHGFINFGGQKMSKSLGNVISPYDLVNRYGTEASRYLLIKHFHPFEDTVIDWDKLDEWYTAHLVNGLGNATSRVMKMAEDYLDEPISTKDYNLHTFIDKTDGKDWEELIEEFRLDQALDQIAVLSVGSIKGIDKFIDDTKPFDTIKTNPKKAKEDIKKLVSGLLEVATLIKPFMPDTSKKIIDAIKSNKKPKNLFPRIN